MSRLCPCIAEKPTPILNTPDFAKIFGTPTPPLDNQGLLRSIEMVALPGTKFEVIEESRSNILNVTTKDYPSGSFYIDSRFVKPVNPSHPERLISLPSKEEILIRLESSVGLPYIWGGNWGKGIPEILSYYQTSHNPNPHPALTFQGVDCSGLLYEATNGCIPRNTSALLSFGEEVSSIDHVKPLDILVWPGHIVIIFNATTTIESLYGRGVIFTNLYDRLSQLSKTNFVIRRFCH